MQRNDDDCYILKRYLGHSPLAPDRPDENVYEQRIPLYGGFSENDLIEQPAIDLFGRLGWKTINFFGEFKDGKSSEGRESRRDVILPARLTAALKRLNPYVSETALDEAKKLLVSERRHLEPVRANHEIYELLKGGVKIKMRGPDGALRDETVRVIDWESVGKNEFLLASQVWFAGDLYTRRADLIGFINGIPLMFGEVKGIYRNLKSAYDENISDYRTAIPQTMSASSSILALLVPPVSSPSAPSRWRRPWHRPSAAGTAGEVGLQRWAGSGVRGAGPGREPRDSRALDGFDRRRPGRCRRGGSSHIPGSSMRPWSAA